MIRGFGPTRFLSAGTPRSGQQAALGSDLVAPLGALRLPAPILAGYDWGGLASCVATALWPERVAGLISLASYDVIDVERQEHAQIPAMEYVLWYQHLFQTERGRECLARYRRDLCRMLWQQWSPGWCTDEATFGRTAESFDNPDFVGKAAWPPAQDHRPGGDPGRSERPAQAGGHRQPGRDVHRPPRAPRDRCGTQSAPGGACCFRGRSADDQELLQAGDTASAPGAAAPRPGSARTC